MSEAVRYGLTDIKGIGEAAFDAIAEGRPYASFDDFLERRGPKCDSGVIDKLVMAGAFDSLEPNRKELMARWEWIKRKATENLCRWRDERIIGPGGLPCTRDWSDVPVELKRDGTPKKSQKGPPKKCTRGCWKYEQIPDPQSVDEWFDKAELREIEMEMFGVYLSSTPFADLDQLDVRACATALDLESSDNGEEALVCVQLTTFSERPDRTGRKMGFLNFLTHDGYKLRAVAFNKEWVKIQGDIFAKRLYWGMVRKSDRGWQVVGLRPA